MSVSVVVSSLRCIEHLLFFKCKTIQIVKFGMQESWINGAYNLVDSTMEAPKSKRFCCTFCVKTVKSVPVIFILCILAWSYYAYVYHLCLSNLFMTKINNEPYWLIKHFCLGRITSLEVKVPYLLMYHVIFIFFLWSYFKTIFTEPGGAPPKVILIVHL